MRRMNNQNKVTGQRSWKANSTMLLLALLFVGILCLSGCGGNSLKSNAKEDEGHTIESTTQENNIDDNIDSESKYISLEIIEGRDFSEEVAWVQGFNAIWYCINTEGKILFELPEDSKPSDDFDNGIAVIDGNKVINISGEIIFDAEKEGCILVHNFNRDSYLYDGFVIVSKFIDTFEVTEEQYGILNNDGNWALELTNEYSEPNYCGSGIFLLTQYNDGERNQIYFNANTGNTFIHDSDDELEFSQGYAISTIYGYPEGITKLIDSEGKEMFSLNKSCYFGSFSEDLIYLSHGENQGFYDVSGNMVVDLSEYNIINTPCFTDGYAFLRLNNEQGSYFFTTIDKQGNLQFEPKNTEANSDISISDGLIKVNYSEFIDMQGNTVVNFNSGKNYDFKNGILRDYGLTVFYLNKKGERVLESINLQ